MMIPFTLLSGPGACYVLATFNCGTVQATLYTIIRVSRCGGVEVTASENRFFFIFILVFLFFSFPSAR